MKYLIACSLLVFAFSCAKKEKETSEENTEAKPFGSIERIDPALDAILNQDAKIEIIAEGFEWSEGPLWLEDQKTLLFSDVPTNTVYKWTEEKGKEIYLTPSGRTGSMPYGNEPGSNGLLLSPEGKLVLCQHGERRVAVMDAPLEEPAPKFTSLFDNYDGKKLNSPNDAVFSSKGDLFVTDPPYGLPNKAEDATKETPFQGVYKVSGTSTKLLVDSITRPNGIALFPGQTRLIVANSDPDKAMWYTFDLTKDGASNGKVFYDATTNVKNEKGLPDGLKIDKAGNVFATGPGGVWIFNQDGRLLGKIKVPEATSNCALSPDEKTLYVTADMYVLRIPLRD